MSERGNCFPFLRKVNGHASGEERNFASPASGYALLKERRKNGPRASVRFSRYRYIGLNPFPALHRFESVSNSILDFFDENLKFFLFFFETSMTSSFSHSKRFKIALIATMITQELFFLREKDFIFRGKTNLKRVKVFKVFKVVPVDEKWIQDWYKIIRKYLIESICNFWMTWDPLIDKEINARFQEN